MHWNAKKWAAVRLPKLAPVQGAAWSPRGIVAFGAGNVWVNEVPGGSLSGEPGPQRHRAAALERQDLDPGG